MRCAAELYGRIIEEEGFGSPFTFTGELLDANDLLYLRARYYSPALDVFTGLDPVENLNRYQYVSANPVNFTDPSGLQEGCGAFYGPEYEHCRCVENCISQSPLGTLDEYCVTSKCDPILHPSDSNLIGIATFIGQQAAYAPGAVLDTVGLAERDEVNQWMAENIIAPQADIHNDFFVESSLSQAIRANPEASIAIAAGAVILIPVTYLAGAAAVGVILFSAGTGAAFGGAAGFSYGEATYEMAASGACGCEIQEAVTQMSRTDFVTMLTMRGVLEGTVYGGLYATGPLGQTVITGAAFARGVEGVAEGLNNIAEGQGNPCNTVNTLLSTESILLSAKIAKNVRANREPVWKDTTPTNPNPYNVRIAPLGNSTFNISLWEAIRIYMRTGVWPEKDLNLAGWLPHYHRAEYGPGPYNYPLDSLPGQGISRHRPWDIKPGESFWDRF